MAYQLSHAVLSIKPHPTLIDGCVGINDAASFLSKQILSAFIESCVLLKTIKPSSTLFPPMVGQITLFLFSYLLQ